MSSRFELIVFDWDGTLMDSAGTIVACIQAAAVDMGMAPPSEARARHVIGLGLHEALRYALPELAGDRYGDLADRYRYHYLAQDHELLLFDGVEALIRELAAAGYLLGVATGKSRKGLDRALDISGLGDCFHATRCADECHSKPHPQMLEELMQEFGASTTGTLMIGDTTHDLEMASNAGIDSVAVAYGAHGRDGLMACKPLHCADSVAELATWLRRNA
jgi:phosphoglycolate phosphatase